METIDIFDFFKYYSKKILYVILITVIGLFISVVYTCLIQVPLYKSSTSMVLAQSNNTDSTITQNDITLNKNLLSTYREIIKSRKILQKVINDLSLNISYGELVNNVDVSSVNDTELIVISVYNQNKVSARDIANYTAEVFKDEIVDIYNIENVSIIDTAIISDNPSNVSVVKQLLIGLLAGFFLSSIGIFILYYFDDTIKTEEDIKNKLSLPVLGAVPKYDGKRGKKYGK